MKIPEQAQDIREICGPLTLPSKFPWYLWLILAFAAAAAAAVFLLSKRRKKQEAFLPPEPAYEIAYEALRLLKEKGYLKRGEFQLYYIELSNIVRRYLESRFNLRAPEMTTEEFLRAVKEDKVLSCEDKSLLSEFLSHCDLVKFARYTPLENEADLSFESAKKLIDRTKEQNV